MGQTRNSWLKLWFDVLDDPKVQDLPERVFRNWINLLLISGKYGGALPPDRVVAFHLRVTTQKAGAIIAEVVAADLFEKDADDHWIPHNWTRRQEAPSAERMRKLRGRNRDGGDDGSGDGHNERHSDAKSDGEKQKQKQKKEENGEGSAPAGADAMPPQPEILAFGEFSRARMTREQHAKLKAKLDGNLEAYIERFDFWVNEAPDAKANGVKRKDRHAYESIGGWYERDVKEGKVGKAPRSNNHGAIATPAESEADSTRRTAEEARIREQNEHLRKTGFRFPGDAPVGGVQ